MVYYSNRVSQQVPEVLRVGFVYEFRFVLELCVCEWPFMARVRHLTLIMTCSNVHTMFNVFQDGVREACVICDQ